MANRTASIWLCCKTEKGWRYCRPLVGRNRKIRPGWALVKSVEQHFPEAFYYIYYSENGKRIWKKISQNPQEAVRAAEFQESYMRALSAGVPIKAEATPVMVSYTLEQFLEEYKLTNRIESYNLMRQTLLEFNAWCRKNIVNRITRVDLLKYRAWLIEKGLSERTAGNKMLRVNQYIRKVLTCPPLSFT